MFEVFPWIGRSALTIGLGLIALAPVLVSCGSGSTEGEIAVTQVVTRDSPIPAGPDNLAERIGFRKGTRKPPAASAAPSYTCNLPEGWSELPTSQFRQGNFRIASAPQVEAYLSILPGAGGGPLANLNRWRKQMGQPDLTIEQAAKLPSVPVLGMGAALVDFEGDFGGMSGGEGKPDYRLIGLLLLDRGYGVFLKMVGPKDQVAAQRDNLLEFARSMREKEPVAEESHEGHDHGFDPGKLRWTGPEGWVEGPRKTMREVTYVPEGSKGAECYISVLSGTAGGLVANVNRWRDQAGASALSPAQIESLPKIDVLGTPSPFIEVEGTFRGMSGPEQEGFMLLAVACELPGFSVFVKMTGPTEVVKAEREKFISFCKSLRQVP